MLYIPLISSSGPLYEPSTTQLPCFSTSWCWSWSSWSASIIAILVYQKVFDTTNHYILQKLYRYGIRVKLLDLTKRFMSECKYQVRGNSKFSSEYTIYVWLFQGYVLSLCYYWYLLKMYLNSRRVCLQLFLRIIPPFFSKTNLTKTW